MAEGTNGDVGKVMGVGVQQPKASPMARTSPTPPKPPGVGLGGGQKGPLFPPPEFKGEPAPSIIPPDVRHFIVATGFFGSGKSTFVAGIDHPSNTLLLDFEAKGDGLATQLGIQNYFAPPLDVAGVLGFDYKPVHLFDRTRQIIEAIPSGRFTTLIIDGLTFFQAGAVEKVKMAPQNYGVDPSSAQSGRFGGAYPGVRHILNALSSIARSKGVKVIGITTELGAKWGEKGPIINKFEMKGVSTLPQMSVLNVVMVKGYPKYNGAPSAIVLKDALGESKWVDGVGVSSRRRLPPKIAKGSMAEVYRYLREPADYGNLKPEEIPTEEELDFYTPTISRAQLNSLRELLAVARLTAAEEGAEE